MKVQVLGSDSGECVRLLENTRTALAELSLRVELEKVDDLDAIMRAGVVSTPALVVDGMVRSTGRVLSVRQIKSLLAVAAV